MIEYSVQPLADDLSCAKSPEDFHHGLRKALDGFDALHAGIVRATGVKLACGEGCSLCCWLRVDLFAHEVLLIAHHVRTHFSPEERAELLSRLTAHTEKVLPLTPFEHATQNVACPLLKDGRCSVYEVRPHSCRRQHSQDLSACQYTYDHPTDLEFPGAHDRLLFRSLSEAMQVGIEVYAQHGFDHTIYELGTALAEALSDPESEVRWMNREKTFLHASVTPSA